MNSNLALLILSWQVACLYHESETDKLLPGSTSATEAESDTLDAIHDELTPDVSWDDFNNTYAKFKSAKDRAAACIEALKNEVSGDVNKVTETTALIHFAEKSAMLQEFDKDLFDRYVKRIIVHSRNDIRFELKCGLTLRERK